jgi:integrase
MPAGIEVRHARACPSRSGGRCACKPTYQAHVWSARDGKRIRKTFPTPTAARAWRQDASVALRRGTMRAPSPLTLRQAAEAWLEGARSGAIRNRSGDPYKPSAIRGYEASLRLRVLPELGGRRFSDVRRSDLQDLADALGAQKLHPSTIQCTLLPLRAMYRRAVARGELDVNPTSGLELPAVRGGRDRIASPSEAAALVAALPAGDRALWATAMYAGLRRGELMALRWEDIDLAGGVIRVERSWDVKEGVIGPKSAVGRRSVPIAAVLRDHLVEHRMSGAGEGLVFGRTPEAPFSPGRVSDRAASAWATAGLDAVTLHECRHTFASLMIAARVNAKALSTYMGHANVSITLDRYGHLMPGNEEEAAGLLDAYLARARAATVAQSVAQEPAEAL